MKRLASTRRHSGMLLALLTASLAGPAAVCVRAAEPSPPDRPFRDVPRDHWAYDAVEELRRLGILRGYPGTAQATAKNAPAAQPAHAPGAPKGQERRRPAPVRR